MEDTKYIFVNSGIIVPFTLGTYSFELGYSTPFGYTGGVD